ncbi:MAG: SGNH/GDSL hydrolase family protein [Deltaproteobacteria bacterium]|nr:SGNH/GDSL hydrolase family protein [Deltaproteobacteria bacterium]
MSLWWMTALAFAAPAQVVALGDGPVMTPPGQVREAGEPVWEMVMADCLQEKAAEPWTVLDRTQPGASPEVQVGRVAEVRGLSPRAVVTLSVTGPWDEARAGEVSALLLSLSVAGGPSVFVVGPVAPAVADQAPMDAQADRWNAGLAQLTGGMERVELVDLWADWPRSGPARAGLTLDGGRLSDQGHARVGAALCEALLKPR